MKKSLLLLSAAVLSSGVALAQPQSNVTFGKYPGPVPTAPAKAPAKAEGDQTLTYTKANDLYTYYYTQAPATRFYVYLATEMTVEDQKPFIGCTIKTVNVTAGATGSKGAFPTDRVIAYVSDKLNAIPEHDTSGTINTEEGKTTSITLDEPVTITGEKPLYFGYMMQIKQNTSNPVYYIPVDGVPTAANVNNTLVAYTTKLTETPQFQNISDMEPGSLYISVNIEGQLKEHSVALNNITTPSFAKTGPYTYTLEFTNYGSNAINSLGVKTVINDGTPVEQTVNLSSPLATGSKTAVDVTVDNQAEGIGLPLMSTVTSINGVTLDTPMSITGSMFCFNEGYSRRPVMEEATGTWCGWCPAGHDMLETLKEKYPDWIRIAVHSGDFMQTTSYSSWVNDYISGFPTGLINRAASVNPPSLKDSNYPELNELFTKDLTYVKVDLSAEGIPYDKDVNVTATVTFAGEVASQHLLSFVVVEDNVKAPITDDMPEKTKQQFMQANYYSKQSPGYAQAGYRKGWSELPEYVEMDFNDVARSLTSYPGIKGSLPAKCEKGSYTYSTTLPIKNVTNENYRIVALVTNAATGEIMNANEISMQKVAVKDIMGENENIDIRVVNGDVIVKGAQNVEVYTLDGRKVATTGLANGVYIICADGKTAKVLVK